jgi:hypothetical protein
MEWTSLNIYIFSIYERVVFMSDKNEIFIKKAKTIHGNLYDYSKVEN